MKKLLETTSRWWSAFTARLPILGQPVNIAIIAISFLMLVTFIVGKDTNKGKLILDQLSEELIPIFFLIISSTCGSIIKHIKFDGSYRRYDHRDINELGIINGRGLALIRSCVISIIIYFAFKTKIFLSFFITTSANVQIDFDLYKIVLLGFICGIASSRIVIAAENVIERKAGSIVQKVEETKQKTMLSVTHREIEEHENV